MNSAKSSMSSSRYGTYEALLADKQVQAVYISTPPIRPTPSGRSRPPRLASTSSAKSPSA